MFPKAFLLFIVAIVLSACATSLKPNARILNHVPGDAPPLYKQGWKDGCKTGLSAGGNDLYRASYSNNINPQLVQNADYYTGWNDAEPYCRHYIMATLNEANLLGKKPVDKPTLPGQYGLAALFNWGPATVHHASASDPLDRFFGGGGGDDSF